MKIQVRRGVFETNSSSVHTICMVMNSDYQKWKNGELVYDYDINELVPCTEEIINKGPDDEDNWKQFYTYEEFFGYEMEYENFEEEITTPSGETVVAFGYYGIG